MLDIKKKEYKNSSWLLFNLANDWNETVDLAGEYPEMIKRFDEIVKKEHQNIHIKEWKFVNPLFTLPTN